VHLIIRQQLYADVVHCRGEDMEFKVINLYWICYIHMHPQLCYVIWQSNSTTESQGRLAKWHGRAYSN